MKTNKSLVDHVLQFPCAECGKPSSIVTKILSKGPNKFFNLIPLCQKHDDLYKKTPLDQGIAKLYNLYKHIKNKGWRIEDNSLIHHDL